MLYPKKRKKIFQGFITILSCVFTNSDSCSRNRSVELFHLFCLSLGFYGSQEGNELVLPLSHKSGCYIVSWMHRYSASREASGLGAEAHYGFGDVHILLLV